jgi:hopanoid-associated phosphorylase
MGERPRVIAVVGMVREARIIAGDGVTVVIGGGDSAGLERKLEAILNPLPLAGRRQGVGAPAPDPADSSASTPTPPRKGEGLLMLSFGVCGALAPDLKAGDLIVGSSVICEDQQWPADGAWSQRLTQALPNARQAAIAAGDAMIGSAAAKRALFEATAAAAVDMESHIVARMAERHALPFAVVRAVSDPAVHALPPAALAGLKADGSADIGAVLLALLKDPGQLPALLRTAREAEAGFRALEKLPASLFA